LHNSALLEPLFAFGETTESFSGKEGRKYDSHELIKVAWGMEEATSSKAALHKSSKLSLFVEKGLSRRQS